MTIPAVVLACVLVAAAGLIAAIAYATRPSPWLGRLERHTVAVVTPEATISGVLVGVYPDVLVLAHAAVLGDATTPVEGEVVIPRGQVRWMQALAPPPAPVLIPRGGEPS